MLCRAIAGYGGLMVRTFARTSASTTVMAIAGVIAGLIALAILLVMVGANEGNMIVNAIVELGRFFSTPFHDMFPQPTTARNVLVNWGIAAVVYAIVGGLIARVVR